MTHYATEPETRAALENRILYNMTDAIFALLELGPQQDAAGVIDDGTLRSIETLQEFSYDSIENLYAPDPDAYGIQHDEGGAVLVRGNGTVVWRESEDAEFVPLVDSDEHDKWVHLHDYLKAKGHLPEYLELDDVVDLDADYDWQAEQFEMVAREVLEWWLVERGLFETLRERGLVVLEAGGLTLWGRTTSGQVWSQDDELRALVGSWQKH